MIHVAPERQERYQRRSKGLAIVSAILGVVYLYWLFFEAVPETWPLFVLLVIAEVFNMIQAAGFWYTIADQRFAEPPIPDFDHSAETVDIYITVYGEPLAVVEATLRGALDIRHPRKRIFVLDDGLSPDVAALTRRLGAGYLTRPDRRGAKAGNINAALARTSGDFILILDADHIPEPEFLERSMGAFTGPDVGFVQTPQYYRDRTSNRVAAGSHDQQQLFYGPILRGKVARGAVFSCGTNVIFRRSAFEAVGGMPEDSITEDLRITLLLLKQGLRGEYVPLVLAHGMGPTDVGGYFSQQLRWARGGLEIFFRRAPYFRGMGFGAFVQFTLSFVYWFTGFVYLIYLTLPVAFLVWGIRPVQAPNAYPIYFLPYVTMTIITLIYATDGQITFKALWFTLGSFPVHIKAFFAALLGRNARFVVTSKAAGKRSLRPVRVHLLAIAILAGSAVYGMWWQGMTPAVMNNVAFVFGHILILQGFVRYALRPEYLAEERHIAERDERIIARGESTQPLAEPALSAEREA